MAAFGAFAGYAGIVALVSGIGVHRQWAIIAAPAYLLAAVAAAWKRRGLEISMALGVAGGLVAPLIWLAARHQGQRELWVIVRGARLLIQHGTPYESAAALAGTQNPDAYNPYLPVMAVFGMARAQLGNGAVAGYAAEIAEHKRDPYELVEEIVGRLGKGRIFLAPPAVKRL